VPLECFGNKNPKTWTRSDCYKSSEKVIVSSQRLLPQTDSLKQQLCETVTTMRLSLVILACLATAFAAGLEETNSAPNSNIENGNDLSLTLFDEESGTNTLENSESSREDEGLDFVDENKDNEDMAIEEEEEESEIEAFENEEIVDEDEGVEDENEDNNEMAIESESETETFENSEIVDENKGVEDENEGNNEMAIESESETEAFENSEIVDENEGVDIVDEDENEDNEEIVKEEDTNPEDESNQINGEYEGEEDEGLPEVDVPTSDFAPTPTHAELTPYPTVYNPPSLRPAVPYVSLTDDPLQDEFDSDGDGYDDRFDWFAKDSETIEELEHDKSVIISLSVVFGVMFFFSIFVASQMLENPDGCCARLVFFSMLTRPKDIQFRPYTIHLILFFNNFLKIYSIRFCSFCRITVACWCGLVRCICYPCRSMCGCTGPSHGEHMMVPDDGRFTHDLELS
jgi:hypothetical protein